MIAERGCCLFGCPLKPECGGCHGSASPESDWPGVRMLGYEAFKLAGCSTLSMPTSIGETAWCRRGITISIVRETPLENAEKHICMLCRSTWVRNTSLPSCSCLEQSGRCSRPQIAVLGDSGTSATERRYRHCGERWWPQAARRDRRPISRVSTAGRVNRGPGCVSANS